ncbi:MULTISPECIES: agmatine deiminase family protein [unclassified Streptomyces]|uniref:agmatine deiminase family protein n=1 Tax=unclassified Streptomyces TaxID=2593676 RepID=UPI001BEAD301|nr:MULTISPECIES: agmatine deiminase family protein [unclassified Streptomyces]MBT2405131.1 hypothetical protein [Streptomyces sp. ISL-21]MBT2459561.1 hypothetical protein [Streptomyces sp. ISL-86]MBT2610899.1 hypothetical protein [Streptomyces sp. ISL-87]
MNRSRRTPLRSAGAGAAGPALGGLAAQPQLDVDRLVGGGGGIHCSTMRQPAAA